MADIFAGDYQSIFTNGWFIGSSGTVTTVYVTLPNNSLPSKQLNELSDLVTYDKTYNISTSLLVVSGVNKEFKRTITYDANTEWYYFDNPYPRLRSTGDSMTLYDFHVNMVKSLKLLDSGIVYVPAYPEYILTDSKESSINDTKYPPNKIITYNTVKSEPGGGKKPFEGFKEIKKRVREQLFLDPLFRKNIDDPSEKLKYYKSEGQMFDNLIQFDVWAKTNYEVENLIDWFENILDKYRGMFKELGMQEMMYFRRVRDDTLLQWKNKLNVRSLIYFFRTEKIKVTEIYPIKRINITAEMKYSYLYPESRLLENEEKILSKWLKNGGI